MAKVSARSAGQMLGRLVTVAPGLAGPPEMTLTAKEYRGYDVEVTVAFDGSRYVVRRIAIEQRDGGPPVTTEAMRDIPVTGLMRYLMSSALRRETKHADGSSTLEQLDDWTADHVTRYGPTDEALTVLAQMYRLAYVCGERPTKAVQDNLKLPRSTAGRWIALARERGILGAAEGPGKAGG